ncbi:retrovirus-related pol polyprotein from transposon TNT 1-94 [Tanacetum coccineum]
MSVLPYDQMNSVINCLTAKSTWDDLILYQEGPSDVKESRVINQKLCYNTFKFKEGKSLTQTFIRYKALMNELVNDGINLFKLEINTGFINGLPKKWLSFCQSLSNTNHVKDFELASLFGKLKYEENLIDSIYETEKNKSLVFATPLSTDFISTSITSVPSYQSPFQSKSLSSSQHKPELRPTKYFEAKYNKVKAKLALLSSSTSASKASMVNNKGLIAESYEWDEEEVSSDDNEMVEVKVLMALAKDNDAVSKEGAKNGEWVKISNINFVCVTCGKCVLNDNHDMCVIHYINGVNSRTKQPIAVPISTREPKRTMNQFVATPLRRTVASESTNQKPRSTIRKLYEHVSKTCSWWYPKFTPSGYKWKHMSPTGNVNINVSMPLENESRTADILEPMTPRCSTMSNTPLFSNSFAVRRDNSIHHRLWVLKAHAGKSQASKVYYVEGLNHNLFSVGQFCDADLEVAFRKSTCYIGDLKGNDLLIASSSQAWLWHRRLSHLNFDTINLLLKYDIVTGLPKLKFVKDHLCSSCELGKAKRKSFKTKNTPSSNRRLQILHMDLCGPMRVESFNGKKYMLVIVDDYSRYTWTYFLRSKDETPEVLIDFLKLVQIGLHAQVRTVRNDKGTKFLNKTLHAYFAQEGIEQRTFVARTPEQNGVVER